MRPIRGNKKAQPWRLQARHGQNPCIYSSDSCSNQFSKSKLDACPVHSHIALLNFAQNEGVGMEVWWSWRPKVRACPSTSIKSLADYIKCNDVWMKRCSSLMKKVRTSSPSNCWKAKFSSIWRWRIPAVIPSAKDKAPLTFYVVYRPCKTLMYKNLTPTICIIFCINYIQLLHVSAIYPGHLQGGTSLVCASSVYGNLSKMTSDYIYNFNIITTYI